MMIAWWIMSAAPALAGPVPMFPGGAPPSLSPPVTPRPRAARSFVVAPCGPPMSLQAITLRSRPEPTRPPALPRVPSEPVKVRVTHPGQMTPVDQLPSAFHPLQPAQNRLPMTRIRPRPVE